MVVRWDCVLIFAVFMRQASVSKLLKKAVDSRREIEA